MRRSWLFAPNGCIIEQLKSFVELIGDVGDVTENANCRPLVGDNVFARLNMMVSNGWRYKLSDDKKHTVASVNQTRSAKQTRTRNRLLDTSSSDESAEENTNKVCIKRLEIDSTHFTHKIKTLNRSM